MSVEDEIDGNPWYFDILLYIKYQRYPEHATENDKRVIRRMAIGYLLEGDTLRKVVTKHCSDVCAQRRRERLWKKCMRDHVGVMSVGIKWQGRL